MIKQGRGGGGRNFSDVEERNSKNKKKGEIPVTWKLSRTWKEKFSKNWRNSRIRENNSDNEVAIKNTIEELPKTVKKKTLVKNSGMIPKEESQQ